MQTTPTVGGSTPSATIVARASIGTPAMRSNSGSTLGSRGWMRSSIQNAMRTTPTGSSGGGSAPAAGVARGGTSFDDEQCQPEELLCFEIR